MGCVPYLPDYSCCDDWSGYSASLQERATTLAWSALYLLTAGRVGSCPVLVRPCRKGCAGSQGVSLLNPVERFGNIYNAPCGSCGRIMGCACGQVSEVVLPGEVAAVGGVYIGGELLPTTAWRVDNLNRLVRQDGDVWPTCQDMTQPWDGADAFSVIYQPGVWPNAAGLWAAGVLACEFAKACSGGKCRLPSSVTSVSRQGVTMQFTEGMFAGGVTGIREVDAYVKAVNPHMLAKASAVWSPDIATARVTSLAHTFPPFSQSPASGAFSWQFSAAFGAAV